MRTSNENKGFGRNLPVGLGGDDAEIDGQKQIKALNWRVGGRDKETRRRTTVASGDSETEMPRTPWDEKKEQENKARKMKMIKIGDMWNQDRQYKGKSSL